MTIDDAVKVALELPDSYFPGSDDEGVTWGRIGVGYNRDSGPRDVTIAECIYEKLHGQFPDDVQWQSASHFGHGWCREIMIRVKDIAGNITDAFEAAVEYGNGFDSAEFESQISAAEYEETLSNISREWSSSLKYPDDVEREDAHKAVFSWLFDAGIQPGGDDGCWFSRDEVELAGLHLGFWDAEWTGDDEFFGALRSAGLITEFRHWCYAVWREEHERTQGVLF